MNINWLTLEQRIPVQKEGWENAPYISCVVFACNPETHLGGVIETCRWDVANNCWFQKDIDRNWFLQNPYEITHYRDKIDFPNFL